MVIMSNELLEDILKVCSRLEEEAKYQLTEAAGHSPEAFALWQSDYDLAVYVQDEIEDLTRTVEDESEDDDDDLYDEGLDYVQFS